jgi:diaminopimelate epimerase
MHFVKMHGVGNDYVYVDGFAQTIDDPAALARAVSDRHFGIGSDGLILVLPPEPGVDADARMRMFNADGSESEMCGNGVRCVCKFVHDRGLSTANPMRVQTGRGVLSLRYTVGDDGKVGLVTVDMGEPILDMANIPAAIPGFAPGDRLINAPINRFVQWPADVAAEWIDACGFDARLTCVSMGNPHAVFYCNDVARIDVAKIGPTLENHPMFPRRINVHFVQVHAPGEVTVVHWERGSGATLACGTGACAVCVAGALTGRTQRSITAHLPGGDLQLNWDPASNHVFMTGPATEVFTGEWPAPVAAWA